MAPLGSLGGPLDPSQPIGRAFQHLPDILEGLSFLPTHPGGLPTPTDPSGRPPDLSQPTRRASRPLPALQEGLLTLPGYSRGLLKLLLHQEGFPTPTSPLGGPTILFLPS